MSAVGDDSLNQAGKGVQNAGAAFGWDMEFVAYFLGDGASRDDGDRIVGRAEVGQGNQPGNAEFRAAPAVDMGRNFPIIYAIPPLKR